MFILDGHFYKYGVFTYCVLIIYFTVKGVDRDNLIIAILLSILPLYNYTISPL